MTIDQRLRLLLQSTESLQLTLRGTTGEVQALVAATKEHTKELRLNGEHVQPPVRTAPPLVRIARPARSAKRRVDGPGDLEDGIGE